jgi:hypothetical protein
MILIYPFLGDAIFTLHIREGGHEGVLFDQIHPIVPQGSANDKPWIGEDYVLLWSK